jgi:hypothetical protein
MKISYSSVWNDTSRMLRANASLVAAIAGAFLFLPALVSGYLAPAPTQAQGNPTAQMMAYYSEHWELLLIVAVIGFVGNLALLILALDDGRPTVGHAIGRAFPLLPSYFLTSVLMFMIVGVGVMALILPGLYLLGRLVLSGPVIVAEGRRNSIDAIRRSFSITKGSGWANTGLILIVTITYLVLNVAATAVFGSIFLLLGRLAGAADIAAFFLLALQAAIGAAFNVTLVVLLASLYRNLAAARSTNGI